MYLYIYLQKIACIFRIMFVLILDNFVTFRSSSIFILKFIKKEMEIFHVFVIVGIFTQISEEKIKFSFK